MGLGTRLIDLNFLTLGLCSEKQTQVGGDIHDQALAATQRIILFFYHCCWDNDNLGHIPSFRIHILGIVWAIGEGVGIVGRTASGNRLLEVVSLLWIHL